MDIEARWIGMAESFLFVAGEEGLTIGQLAALMECDEHYAENVVSSLGDAYDGELARCITLKRYGGKYRLVTKSEWADAIKRMLEDPKPAATPRAGWTGAATRPVP